MIPVACGAAQKRSTGLRRARRGHGSADTDVPVEQSRMMVREFEEKGVPFQYHEIANGGHGLGGGKPEEIENSDPRAFEFLKLHLEKR